MWRDIAELVAGGVLFAGIDILYTETVRRWFKGALNTSIHQGLQLGIRESAAWARGRAIVTYQLEDTMFENAIKDWIARYLRQNRQRVYAVTMNHRDEDTEASYTLGVPDGKVTFRYRGRFFMLRRALVTTDMGSQVEKLCLFYIGRDESIARQFLDHVVAEYNASKPNFIRVYHSDPTYGNWLYQTTIAARPLSSVILPSKDMNHLLERIASFLGNREYYMKFGVPYKMGITLYGIPGGGKTTALQALAGHFKMNMYMLRLGDPGMTDISFNKLMSRVPRRSIVIIEDLDATLHGRKNVAGSESNTVSGTGLLNGLDGTGSYDGVIVAITTNHIEVVDAAVIRKGRCGDVKIEFKPVVHDQVKRMFLRFHELAPERIASEFADAVIVHPNLSMAQIQDYMLIFREDWEAAYAQRHLFLQLIEQSATRTDEEEDPPAEEPATEGVVIEETVAETALEATPNIAPTEAPTQTTPDSAAPLQAFDISDLTEDEIKSSAETMRKLGIFVSTLPNEGG